MGVNIIFAMEKTPSELPIDMKMDLDLFTELSLETARIELQSILTSNNTASLTELYAIVYANPTMDAIDRVIDTVVDEPSLRNRISGYESVFLFVSLSIIVFLVINHWESFYAFLSRNSNVIVDTTLHIINVPRLTHDANILLNDPARNSDLLEFLFRHRMQ